MPQPGDVINGYKVIAKLGSGGMATVYRALQVSLGREVALKVVAAHLSGDSTFCDRFLREARAGALVNHPNVVTCYDTGQVDGQLYMAMELVTGGDLAQLLERRGGRLDERLALALLRDACAGLEAVEGANLVHRDLKPANIFLTDKGGAKLADLGLVRFAGDDRMTTPGTVMGTPAYIAPEQARGQGDVDIRADIYSLGATLFHLLTGAPPFISDNPLSTLVKSLNEPMPDPRSLRGDLSLSAVAIIARATQKDRAARYQSARQLREDLDAAHAGLPLRHAAPTQPAGAPAAKPAAKTQRTPLPTEKRERPTTAVTARQAAPPAARGEPVPPAMKIDPEQLKALTKRIVVDKDGLKASLILAPGASFPRFLLDQILLAAEISYGLVEGAIHESTRPSTIPRRIVLARGDAPAPGMGGRSVRGEAIPPLDEGLVIRVGDGAMEATALTRPGELITREQLEPVLKRSGIRFGLDVAGLHRLCEGPAAADGRVVIARGRATRPGRSAGFVLNGAVANTTVGDLAESHQLRRVQAGMVLGQWSDGETGTPGMDVFARALPAAPLAERRPEECLGEGVELGRDQQGRLVVRATRSGLCQRQEDGSVRVVGAMEIDGDLDASHGPIVTDDVVVVRGNVAAGVSIRSTSDVVILGDLADAEIQTGGSLEVQGTIGPGTQPLTVAGAVVADGTSVRRIMAGSLRISGEVRNCELTASGDIEVGRVVGGSLTAGGSVTVEVAGDRDGTTTELWAGHHLSYGQQAELARLAEARHETERSRLIADCKAIEAELADAQRRNQRIGLSQFARKDVLDQLQNRLSTLEEHRRSASEAAETVRHQLAQQRKVSRELQSLGDDAGAGVRVKVVAHEGVVARLADVEPEVLGSPRLQYRLGVDG